MVFISFKIIETLAQMRPRPIEKRRYWARSGSFDQKLYCFQWFDGFEWIFVRMIIEIPINFYHRQIKRFEVLIETDFQFKIKQNRAFDWTCLLINTK